MKTETKEEVREEIRRLENLRSDIHYYAADDDYLLWRLDEAIKNLKNAIR